MAIIEVDEDTFHNELSIAFEKNNIVILKFGSEYCEPCHALECELEELDEEVKNISILMIDMNESPELADEYNILELPTMIIYKDSKTVIYNEGGVILAPEIKKIVKEN
jgi:thioredoxin 1